MGVSAIPFLLPVMFQIGFGYDAFDAGLMMMTVFAANLVMKPLTTSVLRRFGFRQVLVVNGLINAAAIAACAAIAKHMPLPVICAILFVGGMSRSMQFTALNTVAFADIPQKAMAAAKYAVFGGLPARHGAGRGARRDRLAHRRACRIARRLGDAALSDRLFAGRSHSPGRRLGQHDAACNSRRACRQTEGGQIMTLLPQLLSAARRVLLRRQPEKGGELGVERWL
jgi:hypothetical protein